MDIFSLAIVLYIMFMSICLAIIFLSDSDIITFLSIHFGKDPEEELKGKVVWVTGASSGIGEGLSKKLATFNSKLVISARRKDELERVKKECLKSNRNLKEKDILVLPFDMTDLTVHEEMFKLVLKHFGKLDILVSNAGRSQRANWHQIKIEVDRELFELNVFSLINMNRIVLNYFLENGIEGKLAVVSSIGGKVGIPYSGSYTASKFALHGYFESLRNETRGSKIQICMLCPGPVFSGLLQECFTDTPGKKFGESMKPTDRRMTAERCSYLSLVALSNNVDESWMAPFPILPITYFSSYMPYFVSKIMNLVGKQGFFLKLRDSRDTLKKED